MDRAPDEDVAVASVFGIWHLTDPGTLIVRFDRNFDGYADADKIPNLQYVHYRSADGISNPDDDLYGRLTLHFAF